MRRTSAVPLWIANAVVANALALHFGYGGVRTPSTAANLFVALLLCGLPIAVPCWRSAMHGFRADPLLLDHAVGAICLAVLACFGALLALGALPWVVMLVAGPLLAQLLPVATVLDTAAAALPVLLLSLLVGLPLAHLRRKRSRRWSLAQRVVRGVAWLPPSALLAVLFFLLSWTPTAWLGDDPMFEEHARLDRGWRSYVVVRVNPAAFESSTIQVMEETPILPGVIGWRRLLARRNGASSASLRDRDGALEVVVDPDTPSAETIVVPLR